MSKIELSETNSGYNLQKINNNFQKIEDEFNSKVLYRDNPVGEPNEMLNDLDMNANRVYNLPVPLADNEAARLKDVQDAVSGITQANLINFQPTPTISATNVQAAIEEIEDKDSQLREELQEPDGASLVGYAGSTVEAKLNSLGSASDSDVQTSITDDIPGRVQIVGAFGGPDSADYRHFSAATNDITTDFNTITGHGLYRSILRGNNPNGPGGGDYFYVVVYRYTASNARTQVAYPYSTGNTNRDMFFRTFYDGNWSTWNRVLTDQATGLSHVAKVSGVRPGTTTKPVGAGWGKIQWNTLNFDYFPRYGISDSNCFVVSSGNLNGNFVLQRPGVYRCKAQIYVGPPGNANASISMYLGITDRGTSGSGDTLLHVANTTFPGGQHPSLLLDVLIQQTGAPRFYSYDWYFLDGGGVTSSLDLQQSSLYCWASVEGVR